MKKTIIYLMIAFFMLLLSQEETLSYKQEFKSTPVHQYISNESLEIYSLIPTEIKQNAQNSIFKAIDDNLILPTKYENGKDLITGSGEEDVPITEAFQHFWEPDDLDSGKYNNGLNVVGLEQGSSYNKAKNYWENKVIPAYVRGDIEESYYWLGRVTHLLEDATVPEHMHLDCHPNGKIGPLGWTCGGSSGDNGADDSSYEEYTGEHFQDYRGLDHEEEMYLYEELIPGFDWEGIEPRDRTSLSLFRLFWYTAQKTQYFASDDVDRDFDYVDRDGYPHTWDYTSLSNSNLWKEEGLTNSNFINKNQLTIDDTDNDGIYLKAAADALVPHAMKAAAGLYRLFWHEVNRDWPMTEHDLQRTSMTHFKGDIEDQYDFDQMGWITSNGYIEYDNPVISDIDRDLNMEIIVTTTTVGEDGNIGRAFVLENNKDNKFRQKWHEDKFPREISNAASIVNINNDRFKEMVFADSDGNIYAYRADNGNRLWKYNINRLPWPFTDILKDIAVADIDLDGKKEIIISDFKLGDYTWPARLYIIDGTSKRTGKTILGTPINIGDGTTANPSGGSFRPTIANICGDEHPEIILPTEMGLYVFEYNENTGIVEELWHNTDGRIQGSAVVADVDGDDAYEIVYTTTSQSCQSGFSCYNRIIKIEDTCDGNAYTVNNLDKYPRTSPAVGNLDADDNLELVFLVTDTWTTDFSGAVYCRDGGDMSSTCSGFPYTDSGSLDVVFNTPVLADTDGDGDLNILVTAEGGWLYVLHENGVLDWKKDFGGEIAYPPAIGDWDGDATAEIAVKHYEGGSQATALIRENIAAKKDPYYTPQNFSYSLYQINEFLAQSTGELSILDGLNKQPILQDLDGIIAIEGALLTITPNATDPNENDTVGYYFSNPFNESGMWQTDGSCEGVYEILVTASDGDLSDSQYVTVTVLRSDSVLVEEFTDSLGSFEFNGSASKSIEPGNNSRLWIAEMRLKGIAQQNQTNFQEVTPIVVEANEYNISSNLIVDKNWSSYYSAGSATGAIVELRDNAGIPDNLGHIVIHLRLKIGNGGHGRFGIYNYDSDNYEIITSTIPSFNESYRDVYFDVYNVSPLWPTNATHFSMKTGDLEAFINDSTDVRWYYRYIDDSFADQKIYESEARFVDNPVYPENISIDLNDDGSIDFSVEGILHEDFVLLDHFSNSAETENFSLSNSSHTRYLRIPKDAEISSAILGFGNNRHFTDINATFIIADESGAMAFDDITGLAVTECRNYNTTDTSSITEIMFWVYCPWFNQYGRSTIANNWWHKADIDSDSKNEYYMLLNETYRTETYCRIRLTMDDDYVINRFELDDVYTECKDGNCNYPNEEAVWEKTFLSPSSTFYYPKSECRSSYGDWHMIPSGYLKSPDNEHFMALRCGMDADCQYDKVCNKSAGFSNPTQFHCSMAPCNPSCEKFEEETYSNHQCTCVLSEDRCEDENTQLSNYYYCDSFNYIEEIETVISINETQIISIPERDVIEADISMYVEDYLIQCQPDSLGYCDVPITFSNEWNSKLILNKIEVTYDIPAIDLKGSLQPLLLNQTGDMTIPLEFSALEGFVNITSLMLYSSPNTAPYFANLSNITSEAGQPVLIEVFDAESDDLLEIVSNSTDFYQINNTHMIWQTSYDDIGIYSFIFNVTDGLLYDEMAITVHIVYTPQKMIFRNSLGNTTAYIDEFGNIALNGPLVIDPYHERSTNDEWVLRFDGNDIASVDMETGSMYIDGGAHETQQSLSPPESAKFMVKDLFGNVNLYLDSSGNLYTKGRINASSKAGSADRMIIRDSDGNMTARFSLSTGDLELKGNVENNSVRQRTGSDEWVIKFDDEDVLILDMETGDLFVDGQVHELQDDIGIYDDSFVAKDFFDQIVFLVNSSGHVFLRGNVLEYGIE